GFHRASGTGQNRKLQRSGRPIRGSPGGRNAAIRNAAACGIAQHGYEPVCRRRSSQGDFVKANGERSLNSGPDAEISGETQNMIRALYSAASGMTAQQLNVDNIANNLANANTAGYKSRRAQFQDLIYQTIVQPGTSSGQQTVVPTGLQLGLGTRAA